MNKIAKKLIKTLFLTFLIMYTGVTIFKQEADFNKYDREIEKYEKLIEQEILKKEQLMNTRARMTTEEYIEEVAREEFNLVLPNEIVIIENL